MTKTQFVVITSINPPTDAVRAFAAWPDWQTIVVGDRKSPPTFVADNVIYLSVEEQLRLFPEFAAGLPENTYVRKMLGYLYAFRHGATAIFESDDDNIPYADAAAVVAQDLAGSRATGAVLASDTGWTNIYQAFGAADCWPRGYPLERLRDAAPAPAAETAVAAGEGAPWAVLQYLADEDPDVDAIYRMTRGTPVFFARNRQYRLAQNTYSPFNSQATLWLPEAFPLMFLPLGVTDRVTDILRGYIALACLWQGGRTLGFASPVVYQIRNAHNLLRDFVQEAGLYQNADSWSRDLLNVRGATPAACFADALRRLQQGGFLPEHNLGAYQLFAAAAAAACPAETSSPRLRHASL
jgi:hypothetical protein